MPKAAPAKNDKEEKQVSEAAFLKAFKKKQAVAKAAAKVKKPDGNYDDKAILERLGIAPGERATFHACVSRIIHKFAKDDPNRPMFIFMYSVISEDPQANGTIVRNQHIIEEGKFKEGHERAGEVYRTEEQAMESLMFELQGLGEDTESWEDPTTEVLEAIKYHTKEKTEVSLTIVHWDKDGKCGMNVYVNNPIVEGDADLGEAEDDESEDETEETEGEEAEGNDGESDFDGNEWVGYWVEFDDDEYGHIRMKVTSYDEDANKWCGTDDNGQDWEGDYAVDCDKCEQSENQED